MSEESKTPGPVPAEQAAQKPAEGEQGPQAQPSEGAGPGEAETPEAAVGQARDEEPAFAAAFLVEGTPAAERPAGAAGQSERAEPGRDGVSSPPAGARQRSAGDPRPELEQGPDPLYRVAGGFRLRLEPADLARLRELPGSKGRTDRELGEEFFEKQAGRLAESLAEDVAPPAEVRVVVDPYSRQVFLAIERTIRSILSF